MTFGDITSHFKPTRLLDVDIEADNLDLRLIEASPMREYVRYITLSHCWGGKSGTKLLKRNLATMKKKISFTSLPLTFQHTIILARKLRIRYIWIDSLCIVQDCPNDWQRESSLMAEVYSNSWLNVAATDSTSGDGGLFRARSPLTVNPCQVTTDWTKGQRSVLEISRAQHHDTEILWSPLNKRGWVLQERFLAPRTVHFCRRQIYWECASSLIAESEATVPQKPTLLKQWSIESIPVDRNERAVTSLRLWTEIVKTYSQTDLSVSSDRLPAISGLARRMHDLSKGTLGDYIAGMWEAGLINQLSWSAFSKSRRSSLYQAPTWSWASLSPADGQHMWGISVGSQEYGWDQDWVPMAEVQGFRTDVVFDMYGSITGGSLTMRCSLFEMAVATNLANEYFTYHRGSYNGPDERCVRVGSNVPSESNRMEKLVTWLDDETEQNLIDLHMITLYGLPLRISNPLDHKMYCHILRRTSIHGQYERVGLLRSNGNELRECIEGACASSCLDESMYLKAEGMSRYIIEII